MAYQITRKKRVKEALELCNEDGLVALRLDVDIDIDAMGARIAETRDTLRIAQELIEREPDNEKAQEAFGMSVIALFAVVFGKDGADNILAFYDGNYGEMLIDVFPFINDVVMPSVDEASAARKQQILDIANAMRKK